MLLLKLSIKLFLREVALEKWFAPGDMTAKVLDFNGTQGGGYTMSLRYPETDKNAVGKFSDKEDRYTARLIELVPYSKIVEAIHFDSSDPSFGGEMIMEISLEATSDGTNVTIVFKNIPSGIRPEDNETGTALSLEKLAEYVDGSS